MIVKLNNITKIDNITRNKSLCFENHFFISISLYKKYQHYHSLDSINKMKVGKKKHREAK